MTDKDIVANIVCALISSGHYHSTHGRSIVLTARQFMEEINNQMKEK